MGAPSSTASARFSSRSPRSPNTQSLAGFGIETPATIAAIGREHIPRAASAIGYPVILKHNRAGKGLGVKLIYSEAALQEHLASEPFEDSIDGIMLVQRYIKAPEPFITRVEFIGGQFLYAVRVDTSQGFELCPADACQIEQPSEACPAVAPGDKFQIVPRFEHALIPAWQSFLAANDIGIAGSSSSTTRMAAPTPTTSTPTPTTIPTPRPRTAVAACKPSPCISNGFCSNNMVRRRGSPRCLRS